MHDRIRVDWRLDEHHPYAAFMHFSAIVAIGWIYVTLLMALAQDSVLAGIGTFVFYGLLPMVILVYLFTTGIRRRRRRALEEAEEARRKTASSDDSSSPS